MVDVGDCSAAAIKWEWTQILKKGHQLSSCSLTVANIFFCCPDIDCSSDDLTFALNQACSGKGLLIRHPFKKSTHLLLLLCLNIRPLLQVTAVRGGTRMYSFGLITKVNHENHF